jgi:hypothetical protein
MHRLRQTAHSLRRPLATLLVLAMLLAQALGSMHGVAHVEGPHGPAHERAGHAVEHSDHAAEHATHALTVGLFDAHQDDADCRVFDQLTHGEAAPTGVSASTETPRRTPPTRGADAPEFASVPADCRARGPPRA